MDARVRWYFVFPLHEWAAIGCARCTIFGRSCAVVGVAGEDGGGAVELFGDDHPGEAMRQGHSAERQFEFGGGENVRSVAVGATEEKGDGANAVVAELG